MNTFVNLKISKKKKKKIQAVRILDSHIFKMVMS